MVLLARLEETFLSVWIRETGWVFFGSLILHSLALALVIGLSLVLNLKFLGIAGSIPDQQLKGFLPPLWTGLVTVSLSGSLLLLAYPAKALTNPVFFLKIGAIAVALTITLVLVRYRSRPAVPRLAAAGERTLASLALLLWATSVFAGRFLAYTHDVLLASRFY